MRAARFHEFGGPEVIRLEGVPDPEPRRGEVVVRVRACGLNRLDVRIRNGVARFPIELPHIPGYEATGEIEALGDGVAGWSVGERVLVNFSAACMHCVYCRTGRSNLCENPVRIGIDEPGAFAEFVRCPVGCLMRLPDSIGWRAGAALYVAFGTSFHMLFTRGNLRAGETVLVNSVGSGIGSAAIQLAKLAGAFVIGTASNDDKLERARDFGLDVGINYTRDDILEEVRAATGGRGVDLAYEHAGGELFTAAIESVGKSGRLVTCGAHTGDYIDFDLIGHGRSERSLIGSFAYSREEIEQCLRLVASGQVQPVVDEVFALDDVRLAMERMERRENYGKIVVETA